MLPMLQTEPLLFGGSGTAGTGSAGAAHAGRMPAVEDLDDDSSSLFCEADVGFDPFHMPSIGPCELQLGDTWGGMQSKMSAVAPAKKIRKKPDSKPQSQINKCINEKRRRELENETINQLEELLSACLSDLKQPDKNGIVEKTTEQIRNILERRRKCSGVCCAGCPPACRHVCPARAPPPATPVQAGEVSSSQPRAHDDADVATLIESLKHYTTNLGWVLLEINCDGEIECVTENVKDIIQWERSELYKQSIYNYLHHGDHQKLAPILQNVQTVAWPAAALETDKFPAIRSRLLVKEDAPSEPGRYVEVVIHAAGVRGGPHEAASVMCVVRRSEDAPPGLPPPDFVAKQPPQLTFKLDPALRIITCDLTGVGSPSGSTACRALEGGELLELVAPAERGLVRAHLRDAPAAPAHSGVSAPFRLRVGHDDTYVTVSAESRLFRNPTSQEGDFIMSTHSLLSEDEVSALGSPATPPVGGPLMTSVANGSGSQEARYSAALPEPNAFSMNDFDLDFAQPSWDYGASARSPQEPYGVYDFDGMTPEESKDKIEAARAAPAQTEEPNRLRTLLIKTEASDTAAAAAGVNNRILKDLLKQEDEDGGGGETVSAPRTPQTPAAPATPAAAAPSPAPAAVPPVPPIPHHAHNNSDMLLRILNEKSDEDNEDGRREGARNPPPPQSALLTQLLSNGPEGGKAARGPQYLDRYLPAKRKADDAQLPAPSLKRSTPETQQVSSSAGAAGAGVASPTTTTSGMSTLCQRNQILVSLLVRQQSSPTTPLPLPNPNLRPFGGVNGRDPRLPPAHPAPHPAGPASPRLQHATPPPAMLSRSSSVNGGTTSSGVDSLATSGAPSHLLTVLRGNRAYPAPAPAPAPSYALPHQPQHFRSNAANPTDVRPRGPVPGGGDGEMPNDTMLSDLLDGVIELEPRPPPDLSYMHQTRTEYTDMRDIERINAITQSLMQVEETVENTSPVLSPGYSAQSPQGALYRVAAEGVAPGRARLLAEQQRARLLQEQCRQAMVVTQGAEQAPADVANTMEALMTSATPPNVSLTRTDYHHSIYHPANQVGSTYGTNKITSQQQQNPMLSAQLTSAYAQAQAQAQAQSGGGGHAAHHAGGAHRPLAPHTPLTPLSPHAHAPLPLSLPAYHQRPHHMGSYYSETGAGGGGGYCVEYARRPHQLDHALASGGSGGSGGGAGGASEYVRQEIRAVVGARARSELPPDLDALGLAYEMAAPGGGRVVGGARSASATEWESHQGTPTTTAGAAAGGEAAGAGARSSLLQKLLSE